MKIDGVVEYDIVGGFFQIVSVLFVFLYRIAPIILLFFIARTLWLIYKLEKRNLMEKIIVDYLIRLVLSKEHVDAENSKTRLIEKTLKRICGQVIDKYINGGIKWML